MTDIDSRLEEINDAISNCFAAKSSVGTLKGSALGENGSFYTFFNTCYIAHLKGRSAHFHEQQWAMIYTYFEDLCDHLDDQMRKEMVSKIDSGSFSMDELASYCDQVSSSIQSEISKLEMQRNDILKGILRNTVMKAA